MSYGTLIGVSLGPGDPGLITRAGWEQLQRNDAVWVYPARSGKTPSYALDIVIRAGLPLPAEHALLLFPMTHDGEKLARAWSKAAQTVLPWLQSGKDVIFLVEGDASTYATFGHLARTLQAQDEQASSRVIAGVNSFTAAAASINWPLAEQDDTLAVIPAAYGIEAIEPLLKDFDTLVLMKVKPILDDLIIWLKAKGLLTHSCFIERCGTPEERVVYGDALPNIAGESINYLSLLLIRNPERIRGQRIKGCLKKRRTEQAAT